MQKFWWKAYFWSIGLLAVSAIASSVYEQDHVEAFDVIDYATWIFSVVGVFGFAYSKPILHKRLWQIWLPLVIGWDLAALARQYMADPSEADPLLFATVVLIVGILFVPEYVALYLYGYRSDSLWSARS
jgi:hypothetical protein